MKHTRPDGPRPAVVATCAYRQVDKTPEALLRSTTSLIDDMAREAAAKGWKLDLAIVPECAFAFVKDDDVATVAEDLEGPTVTAIAEKARQYRTYATAPVQTKRDGRVYNSVVLVDRKGEIAGVYDKVFPVMVGNGSLEYGIAPGSAFPVFDLDFGRVGMQICWDMHFDPGWQALADQDAELVIFCTNPAQPVAMRARGWRHSYYIAASTTHPPSMMVDPLGRELGRTTRDREVFVRRLDLDYRVLHSNCMWEWNETRAKPYEGRISIEWDVDAHSYLLTSLDPKLPVRAFLEKEGIVTGRQRVRRNVALQLEARGCPPPTVEALERE